MTNLKITDVTIFNIKNPKSDIIAKSSIVLNDALHLELDIYKTTKDIFVAYQNGTRPTCSKLRTYISNEIIKEYNFCN